jgi:hypothetical protein
MGIVQNVMGIVRDVNDRKENARIKDVMRNNLNEPDLGLEGIMQINPIKGMKFEDELFERRKQEIGLADARNKAIIDRLGVATQYLRGVPIEKREEVMASYAPLFHELIGPDNYSAFTKAALSDPNYLASVDDATFREMFKSENEMRTVTPGSVVLRGGKEIFRNPHKMTTANTPQGAVSRVFDPNTGTYLDEDGVEYATPTDQPAPGAGSGFSLTVDALRPHFVAQESGGDYTAINKETGALGAYQVMPETGQALAKRLGLPWRPDMMRGSDPASKRYQDAIGGAAIAEAIDASGGDPRTLAMYYYGGSDRSKWGPRTRKYGDEMVQRFGAAGGGAEGRQAQPVLGSRTTVNPKTPTPTTPGRILSPEEAQALGFSPGTVVQQDGKGYKVVQAPPKTAAAPAATAKAEEARAKRENAQRVMNSTLGSLANNYVELLNMGAITSTARSPSQNALARLGASGPGQFVGEVLGTEAQTLRQTIRNSAPILLNTVRQASEMGARGMDSNKELEFYAQAIGDVSKPIEANLAALIVLDMAYGSQDGQAILRQLPPNLRPRVQKQLDIIMREDNIKFGKPGEGLYKDKAGGLQRLGSNAEGAGQQELPVGTVVRNPQTGQRKRKTASGWEDIK